MKEISKWGPRLTAGALVSVLGLVACSSAGVEPVGGADDEDVDSTSAQLWGGYTTQNCSKVEDVKIHEAVGVLIKAAGSGFNKLKSCLQGAAFVENQCKTGAMVAEYFRRDDVLKVTCYDAPSDDEWDAPTKISGERMSIDHDMLANKDATFIAGVIAHALMHNRGLLHTVNKVGSKMYPNTVPQQARACITTGKANPWKGSGTQPAQDAGCTKPVPDCRTSQRPVCCAPITGGCESCVAAGQPCP